MFELSTSFINLLINRMKLFMNFLRKNNTIWRILTTLFTPITIISMMWTLHLKLVVWPVTKQRKPPRLNTASFHALCFIVPQLRVLPKLCFQFPCSPPPFFARLNIFSLWRYQSDPHPFTIRKCYRFPSFWFWMSVFISASTLDQTRWIFIKVFKICSYT